MIDLEYKFTNDVLFKWLFTRNQDLLKRLIAGMLGIQLGNISDFVVTNPDIPPEILGEKFCRLDISMKVDGRKIGLEMQVAKEGDYPERSLYYWAREYSSTLEAGGEYFDLPRTIVISILAYKLFECVEYFSEYKALEVTRRTALTDRFRLLYYELPKLPAIKNAANELELWLTLFNAQTEEDLENMEAIGGDVMKKAIIAYRTVTAADEFKEIERMRSDARHNEASALGHARREAEKVEREKWQGVVADKDATIALLRAQLDAQNKPK